MKILVLSGPNLNLLELRDREHYGTLNMDKIIEIMRKEFPKIEITHYQSNLEGELINYIQDAPKNYDAIIINPGGYSHTSVAIRDALEMCKIPKVEVHLSNILARESFRNISITASVCNGYISGFKEISYLSAVYTILKITGVKI